MLPFGYRKLVTKKSAFAKSFIPTVKILANKCIVFVPLIITAGGGVLVVVVVGKCERKIIMRALNKCKCC